MGKKLITGIVLILLALVGVYAWSTLSEGRRQKQGPETARVVRRDLSSKVLATGEVNVQVGAKVKVGARVSGKVEDLFANIGDEVEKDQVIARIEQDDLEAVVQRRRAELEEAEARLSTVKNVGPKKIDRARAEVQRYEATLHQARRHLERQERLIEKDFTSEESLDLAQEQVDVTRAQLAAAKEALKLAETEYEHDLRTARAGVDKAEAALQEAEVKLSYATIKAPISGVIGTVTTQEGETVAAGLQAPTFVTVIDLERLEVDAYVDEVDVGKVEVGQKAEFTVETYPDRTFTGEVTAIYPDAVIRENVVYYDVVVKIQDDYEGLLRPRMTANVTIFQEAREGVLAIPMRALQREEGRTTVYLWQDGEARKQQVKTGLRSDRWVEVVDGLREGQEVLMERPDSSAQQQ